jgi:hypothetical protein
MGAWLPISGNCSIRCCLVTDAVTFGRRQSCRVGSWQKSPANTVKEAIG